MLGEHIEAVNFGGSINLIIRGARLQESIFKEYLDVKSIFRKDRDVLRPSYIPEKLLLSIQVL